MRSDPLNHWQRYPTRWAQVQAPLRPNHQVTQAFHELIGESAGRALLLGVTPEIAGLFEELDAIDKNPEMIAAVWPGDSQRRRAWAANWLALPDSQGPYAVIAGDGSLNNMESEETLHALCNRIDSLLAPNGRFVCRIFERPTTPFSEANLKSVISGQRRVNFHAFKWMLAMNLAEQGGMSVRVADILADFTARCPDREQLSRSTGWPLSEIATIDVYQGSQIVYIFPNRCEFLSAFSPELRLDFRPSGNYDLAECCPLITYQKM